MLDKIKNFTNIFKKEKKYSIKVIVALPGVGKTSTAQLICTEALNKGEQVWSNMYLKGAFKLDMSDFGKYNISNGLLIIDEAGLFVNNRNWSSMPKTLLEFLKLHRHYKMDVYFFSQGDDIDISIKRLAQEWYKLVKCRIPFIGHRYCIAIPVTPNLVLENGDWHIKYEAQNHLGSRKRMPIYKTWKDFNTYESPNLPQKDWVRW